MVVEKSTTESQTEDFFFVFILRIFCFYKVLRGRGLKKFKNLCARVKYAKIVAAIDIDNLDSSAFLLCDVRHGFAKEYVD